MDFEQVRQLLENAAQTFLSAANSISGDQRRAAEKVFLEFRRSNFSFDLHRYLIEKSNSSYVIYQTLTALRESIVKDWFTVDGQVKEQVVQYLLSYVYSNFSVLSVHVREQALQILVVINKRRKAQRAQLAQQCFTVSSALINLLRSNNEQEFRFGLTLLNAFLTEYSFSNANEAGLTVEQRHLVKRDFENHELKSALEILLNKIQQTISSIASELQLFSSTLTLVEKILRWNFSSSLFNARRLMEAAATADSNDWRPPSTWKVLVFDHQLLQFFFHVYAALKASGETKIFLQFRCEILKCLSQLACLNGPLLNEEPVRLQYFTTFAFGFVSTFLVNSTLNFHSREIIEASNVTSNLLNSLTLKGFLSLNNDLCNSLLTLMSKLTVFLCRSMKSSSKIEEIAEDPSLVKETFDRLLQTWSRLLFGIDSNRFETLRAMSIEIFDVYLQTRLHVDDKADQEEIQIEQDENELDDRDLFSEQLIAIGLFARHIVDYSLPLIVRILTDRTNKFYNLMSRASSDLSTNELDRLNDDLHWLLLIAGHLLTEELESDEPKTIPPMIMNFSFDRTNSIDLEKTRQIIEHVLRNPNIELNEEIYRSVDPVVQCLTGILRLSELEKHSSQQGLFDYISVQVAVSLTWFIRRFATNYLLFDEQSYDTVSSALSLTFGNGSETSELLTNYFLSKVVINLQIWSSESDVIKETADLFVNLSTKKDLSKILVKNELFWSLSNSVISNQMPIQIINEQHKRLLVKGITCSCLSNCSDEHRLHFDRSVFQTLNQRLRSIVESIETLEQQIKLNGTNKAHCNNALQTFYTETVLNQVSTLINSYCGLIEGGSRCSSTIHYLFEQSQPTLNSILTLFEFYHNFADQIQIILELFSLYAEHVLVYLNNEHSQAFYKFLMKLFELFNKNAIASKTREINADEELNEHLQTLLTCLNHLLAKDFIDFSNETANSSDTNVGDVVLYGLIVCLPIIQRENLLKIPSISCSYYKLISSLCDQHSDCIFRLLSPEDFSVFLSTIKLAFDSYDNEICKACLESIQNLALQTIKQNKSNELNEKSKYLEPIIDYLFQEFITSTATFSDLFESLSGAIFGLICAFPNQFYQYLGQLKQQDENLTSLIDRFVQEIGNNFEYSRKAKVAFTSKFESFVTDLRRSLKK